MSKLIYLVLGLFVMACGQQPMPDVEATVESIPQSELAKVTPTPSPMIIAASRTSIAIPKLLPTSTNIPVKPAATGTPTTVKAIILTKVFTPVPTLTPVPIPLTTTTPVAVATVPPSQILTPKPSKINNPRSSSVQIPRPTLEPKQSASTDIFWNDPLQPVTQRCNGNFEFTHKLANPSDIEAIGVSPGSHIAPHDHMAYWGTADIERHSNKSHDEQQVSERVQLYNPVDIFFIDVSKNTKEWGATLYACNGHAIMLGHISEPSEELSLLLTENEPEPGCDKNSCRWLFPGLIPGGTPLFKSSGYTSGFDFGLSLAGLTAEELQKQPGYGYSITPWRTGGSGNAVCPLEYFKEPLRSEYIELLGDFNCGPFNQDVPGTAMGFWLNTPSTNIFPGYETKDEWDVDEWETIWLYQDFRKDAHSTYNITVGHNTFGLDSGPHAEYSYSASKNGPANLAWDNIKSGKNYCVELRVKGNMFVISNDVHKILIVSLSEDAKKLTVEAIDKNKCGDGPWVFQGGEKTFYR